MLPLLAAALASAAVTSDDARVLRGAYPDFVAPLPAPLPASACDATASPCAAKGDGTTDDTAALQRCIDSGCKRAADGRFAVVLKAGKQFLSGSLNLTSGLTLVVDGTVRQPSPALPAPLPATPRPDPALLCLSPQLLGSTDPSKYPVIPPLAGYGPGQRDKAMFGYGRHQALLSGWNMSHVTVTGSGIIDGQGLVKDPKLGSSWMSRFTDTGKCKPNCKPNETLDFGRPRVWEPMFSQVRFLRISC